MPKFDVSDLLGEAAPTGAGQPAHPVDSFLNDDAAFKPRSSSTPPPAPKSMLDTVKDVAIDVGTTVGDSLVRSGLNMGAEYYDAFGQTDKADEIRLDASRFAAKAPDITDPNVSYGRYAAERSLEMVPQVAATLAVLPLGATAALTSMFLPLYGEARRNILDETGEDSPLVAAIPASFNTVLETGVVFSIAKKLGIMKPAQDAIAGVADELKKKGAFDLFKDAAAFGTQTAFVEASVESAQWAANLATVRLLKNEELLGALSEQEQKELINSFAGGFSAGGTIGATASVVGNTLNNQQAEKVVQQFRKEESDLNEILDKLKAKREATKPAQPYANVDRSTLPIGGIEPDAANPKAEVLTIPITSGTLAPTPDSADTETTSANPPARDLSAFDLNAALSNQVKDDPLSAEATVNADPNQPKLVKETYRAQPYSYEEQAASLITEQKDEVAQALADLPPAISIEMENALLQRLYAVQAQIQMLDRSLSWTGAQYKENIPNHRWLSPSKWSEQPAVDVFNGAVQMEQDNYMFYSVLAPNNQFVTAPLNSDKTLAATSGVHLLVHPNYISARTMGATKGPNFRDPNDPVVKNLSEVVNTVSKIFTDLGLDTHPVTGNPVKLNIIVDELPPHVSGVAYPSDPNTFNIGVGNAVLDRSTALAETVLHEMGHLLMVHTLSWASPSVANSIKKAWQDSVLAAPGLEDYRQRFVPSLPKEANKLASSNPGEASYLQSPAEFAAEQFRIAITRRGGKGEFDLRTKTPSFFATLLKKFRRLYAASKAIQAKYEPEAQNLPFDKFIDLMFLKKEEREIKSQLEQRRNDAKATAEVTGKTANKAQTPLDGIKHLLQMVNVPQAQQQKVADLFDVNMGFLGTGTTKLLTPLQIAEQADKRGFNLPNQYMSVVQLMQITKMRIVEKADGLLKELVKSSDKATRVSKLLYTISTASDEKGSRLDQTELDTVFKSQNASQEDIDLWTDLDKLFTEVVDDIEGSLVYEAAQSQTKDKVAARAFRDAYMSAKTEKDRIDAVEAFTGESIIDLTAVATNAKGSKNSLFTPFYQSLQGITGKMGKLRNKNYFPRSRFGSYYTRVIATQDDTTWDGTTSKKAGGTVGFYTFESKAEQDSFLKDLTLDKATAGAVRFVSSKMSDELVTLQGMPAAVVGRVRKELETAAAAKSLPLDRETKQILDDLALELTPGRKFLRHLTRRKGIAGYSEDAVRTYASYMSSAANHVARAEHAGDMLDALSAMDQKIKEVAENSGDNVQTRDLQHIADYYRRHFSYLMSAEGEWAALRAAGFTWYLGFNIKSAVLNFMQTPMVLFPVLIGHTSVANATRRINGAIASLPAVIKRKGNVEPGLMATIDYLIGAGLIDESMVSDLAGYGEQNVLERMVPGYDLKTIGQKFAYYGGAMFRVGEKLNRYIAGIAAYRVAKDKGMVDQNEINLFVRDIVQGSQFEYSRFNRAEFMRGKTSFIFTFWQYMQQASYLLFGGKGARTAMAMWALALVIGGAEGLPFAEIIMGLVDIGGTQIKKALGYSNPKFELKKQIRELITEYSDNPYSVAIGTQGISSVWGLGPLHALSLLGAPVPNVSTFGSLSYGNPVPWFEGVLDPTVTDEEKLVYKTVAAVAGPVGGIALSGIKGLMSDEPDQWKRFEAMAPIFMRNASTGVRWIARGEEQDKGGATLFEFATPEQRAEAILKGMGFQSSRVDQTRKQMRAVQVAVMYHESRRQMLLQDLYFAEINNSREGRADAIKAIIAYNTEVLKEPSLRPMAIPGSTLSQSVRGKMKEKAYKELGIYNGVNAIPLTNEMKELYPTTGAKQ